MQFAHRILLEWKRLKGVALRSQVHLVFTMTTLSFILFIASIPILNLIELNFPSAYPLEDYGRIELFFLATLIAPGVETFLFQLIPIELMWKWNISKLLMIVISAILFSISHLSSYTYAVANLTNGIILAGTYIISRQRDYKAYLCTFTVHSLRNLIVYSITLFLDL